MPTGIQNTQSAEETEAVARAFAATLVGRDVVALTGELGAGKTHFTRGLAAGLDVPADVAVSSPTFAIVQEYSGGRLPLAHFDFYRLESADELLDLGWDDYLDRDGIIIVEWADKFPALLPSNSQWWTLAHAGGDNRTLTCQTYGP